jgi:hypothetical protein
MTELARSVACSGQFRVFAHGLGYNFGFEISVLATTRAGFKSEILAVFRPVGEAQIL